MPKHINALRLLNLVLLAIAFSAAISGCSKKEKSATQVVVRVDGEEVSIHQVNGVLSRMGQITPENLPAVRREVVQGLVDQQLAVNLATSKKLERSPEVVTAIENAKREILARAVLDQVVAGISKPTDEDAKKYFAENPALFSQRRVFNFQEIAFRKNATVDIADVRAKVGGMRAIAEVASLLKSKNIEFKYNEGTRAAEQVPLEILPKLQDLKDGQMSLIEGNEGYLVIRMVSSRAASVSESQAVPRIKQFLFNQRAAEAIKAVKLELRSKAKIEYFGEFAPLQQGGGLNSEGSAKLPTAVDAGSNAEGKAEQRRQPLEESDPKSAPQSINIEKGIKGLK